MKIYTRTGDRGETGLIGARVSKAALRVAAYGEIDELSAVLGVVRARADGPMDALLRDVQRDLFAIGAQLASTRPAAVARKRKAAVTSLKVRRIERAIDRHEADLPALTTFILPAGSPAGALLHVARAVCRRAERSVVALADRESVPPVILAYLNRLSDLLFVLARHVNQSGGHPEDPW
jgi:cob(I)alamin adenosyltransferase